MPRPACSVLLSCICVRVLYHRGLPSLAVVLSQIKAMIEQETVEEITYQIQTKLRSLGVTDVTMPLEIICLRWGAERTLDVVRSTDRVTRQRNECFSPSAHKKQYLQVLVVHSLYFLASSVYMRGIGNQRKVPLHQETVRIGTMC